MKAINCMLFVKKGKDGKKARFWITISSPKQDEDGKTVGWVQANMTARLSKEAKERMKEIMTDTKNDEVKKAAIAINDGWLQASETKDGESFVVIFINKLAKRESNPSDDDDF